MGWMQGIALVAEDGNATEWEVFQKYCEGNI
jgi:hypothetical protein